MTHNTKYFMNIHVQKSAIPQLHLKTDKVHLILDLDMSIFLILANHLQWVVIRTERV